MPATESHAPSNLAGSPNPPAGKFEPQTWVEIDLEAIRRNFHRVARLLPPEAPIIFSVKKDAYGHGLIEVVRALSSEPRYYAAGVATVDEALALRDAGVDSPILCFSVLSGDSLLRAIRAGITLTVTDRADSADADRAAHELGTTAEAHLKIDTGMGRIGRQPSEAGESLPRIIRLPNLELSGLCTHLPDGWRNPDEARRQMDELVRIAGDAGLGDRLLHLGGSDGLSVRDHPALGALRSGIAVYGYHPGVSDLEPGMHFKTRVIYRRRLAAGSPISYHGTHKLGRDSELAIIGAGYGNGYPVAMSNRASVLIAGRRRPVLGRVCMDQTVVDVTDAPDVRCGDEVVLFGTQAGERLGAEELAVWGNTIPYELICMAGQINPRFYQPANASPESSAPKPSRNVG